MSLALTDEGVSADRWRVNLLNICGQYLAKLVLADKI
jgi:hypothetical protein